MFLSKIKPILTLQANILRKCLSSASIRHVDVNIYWGSQTGTAQNFASEFATEAESNGIKPTLIDLKDFNPKMLNPSRKHVFLLACYGMGEPTDNARKFYEWTMSKERQAPDFQGIDFAVFGLGSKKTHQSRFCVVGVNVDRQLEKLGCHRIFDRVDGDDSDCIESQFEEWQQKFLEFLKQDHSQTIPTTKPTETTSTTTSSSTTTTTTTTTATKSSNTCAVTPQISFVKQDAVYRSWHQIFHECVQGLHTHPDARMMPIIHNKELTPRSDRSTKEIALALCDDDVTRKHQEYTTGDHIVVYPHNNADLVDDYISRLQFSSTQPDDFIKVIKLNENIVLPIPQHIPAMTYRQILTHFVDLTSPPSPRVIRTLADILQHQEDKARLVRYTEKQNYTTNITRCPRSILDLLREFPEIQVPAELFLQLATTLQPRFYSLSSSHLVHANEVHLTYRVVKFRSCAGVLRNGVNTSWMQALPPAKRGGVIDQEDKGWIPAYIWKSEFKLPKDTTTPVIMVAGGAGIAPFKGFIEHRNYLMSLADNRKFGPYELYYGNRDPTEYAYEHLIKDAASSGCLTHLAASFSRNPPSGQLPMHVAEDMTHHVAQLSQHLQNGGYVYVCGGATGFGPSIVKVFKYHVFQQYENLSAEAAEAKFADLLAAGRYLEDLSD